MASGEREACLNVMIKLQVVFEWRPCIGTMTSATFESQFDVAMWIDSGLLRADSLQKTDYGQARYDEG